MHRRRHIASVVLGTFSSALTILPWLHTLNHRDDHVDVDGAIVFVGHDDDDDDHDHEEEDGAQPGVDHPDHHHGPHERGALAHGAAFILAGTIYILPPPAAALERLPVPSLRNTPTSGTQRSPRVTRGPPLATCS